MFRTFFPAALVALAAWSGAASAQAPSVDGEVRKIDKAQQKITLKHGPIKNIDMPAMTMVFRVKDPGMLDAVSEGDRVRFTAEKVNGQFMITSIGR